VIAQNQKMTKVRKNSRIAVSEVEEVEAVMMGK
jgi:hypothetical protein